MNKPVRAALYARVSTTGHGQDVGLQLDALRRLAETRGWSPVEVYVDGGVSGAKDSRPALDRMRPTPAPASSTWWRCGNSTVSRDRPPIF